MDNKEKLINAIEVNTNKEIDKISNIIFQYMTLTKIENFFNESKPSLYRYFNERMEIRGIKLFDKNDILESIKSEFKSLVIESKTKVLNWDNHVDKYFEFAGFFHASKDEFIIYPANAFTAMMISGLQDDLYSSMNYKDIKMLGNDPHEPTFPVNKFIYNRTSYSVFYSNQCLEFRKILDNRDGNANMQELQSPYYNGYLSTSGTGAGSALRTASNTGWSKERNIILEERQLQISNILDDIVKDDHNKLNSMVEYLKGNNTNSINLALPPIFSAQKIEIEGEVNVNIKAVEVLNFNEKHLNILAKTKPEDVWNFQELLDSSKKDILSHFINGN